MSVAPTAPPPADGAHWQRAPHGGVWLKPCWPDGAAPPGVRAAMTTRVGGLSCGDFSAWNLRAPRGPDDEDAATVAENRCRAQALVGAPAVWLDQVHGVVVQRLHAAQRGGGAGEGPQADGAFTTDEGVACAVQVADCLPVLFADRGGVVVGAAHAGWRGLAGGVLERTVHAMVEASALEPSRIVAWLGPCIGAQAFEVGRDVLEGFGVPTDAAGTPHGPLAAAFRHAPRPDGQARWHADLVGLARARLREAGVAAVAGGHWCTFDDAAHWYSFRRAPRTGRMAALIARGGAAGARGRLGATLR